MVEHTMPTCKQCGASFPYWIRVDGKRRNLSHRTRCLVCLPFGAGRDVAYILPRPTYDNCILCGRPNGSSRRRRCAACNTKIRRFRTKAAAIKYLGGVCQHCGWSGHQSGFTFHHLYGKDFNIGGVANRKWSVVKQELVKCQLLCARCHAIEHSTREDQALIDEAERYQGKLLVTDT